MVPTVERGERVVVFLFDGDRGRKSFDGIDVGALHLIQELPRVGGERFDVAALAFGVERVEGERGLAGAGKTRDHRKRVARDFEADVLQVVLPRAADDDFLQAHVSVNPYRGGRRYCGAVPQWVKFAQCNPST